MSWFREFQLEFTIFLLVVYLTNDDKVPPMNFFKCCTSVTTLALLFSESVFAIHGAGARAGSGGSSASTVLAVAPKATLTLVEYLEPNIESTDLILLILSYPKLSKMTAFETIKPVFSAAGGILYRLESRRLDRKIDPSFKTALELKTVFLQMLEFLVQIHSLGYIHGDFTESNILWEEGQPRIIDFEEGKTVSLPEDKARSNFYKMIDFADLIATFISYHDLGYIQINESTAPWIAILSNPKLYEKFSVISLLQKRILEATPLTADESDALNKAFNFLHEQVQPLLK